MITSMLSQSTGQDLATNPKNIKAQESRKQKLLKSFWNKMKDNKRTTLKYR